MIRIIEDQFLMPSPAGAYHAIASKSRVQSQQLIFHILECKRSPVFKLDQIQKWMGTDSADHVLGLIYHMQKMGLLQGLKNPQQFPEGPLDEVLPRLLGQLSSHGKALLADSQGFYIANQGYAHEAAEELSALSADIGSMHERHQGLLNSNLKMQSSAWSIVDANGNSQIGFWPLYIGQQRFVLVLTGLPRFNQQAFIDLAWVLSKRYASEVSKAVGD